MHTPDSLWAVIPVIALETEPSATMRMGLRRAVAALRHAVAWEPVNRALVAMCRKTSNTVILSMS